MKWVTFLVFALFSVSAILVHASDSLREEAAKNPRNRSFSGSFNKVDEQERERMEDRNSSEAIEDLRNDPFYQKEDEDKDPNEIK